MRSAGSARPPVPGPVGRLAARLYGWEIGRRNRRYDAGRGVVRFDRPVISVGNLSVGGTGKTPMVAHIVGLLLDAGHRPCIAMRGYGSRQGGWRSDEAEEYRARFPSVPIVAQPDRTLGLIRLFAREHERDGPHTDCIVLDDGFQHRRIARDLDIVLIDATRDPFHDRLLPAGWLREPVESLTRAGLVVVTHAQAASSETVQWLSEAVGRLRARPAEAVARHAWAGLSVHERGSDRPEPLDWLRGKPVLALCAIGNPAPFLEQAERAVGAPLAGAVVLRDHRRFDGPVLDHIAAEARRARAEAILTTEKDWARLAPSTSLSEVTPVARTRLALEFEQGGPDLQAAVLACAAAGASDE